MCGIAGFVLREGRSVAERRLAGMTDAVRHRGPDGEGHVVLPAGEPGQIIALGHRRLAILDLSEAGRQPMATADETCWITYNGELYNFWELRRDLEAQGERFSSRSDTEVLLRALALKGEAALERCNGMWAFAFWDGRRRRLILSRDRLGIKPLYYAEHAGGLVFGSEIKVLLAAGVRATLRPEAIGEYLRYGYTPDPDTPFREIRQLEPGTCLIYESGRIRLTRFWDLRPFLERQVEATPEALLEQLDRAVRRQVISDVPIGAFLSGGIDSSAVVAAMAANGGTETRTFCISFQGSAVDEAPFARQMAEHVGAAHKEYTFGPSDVSLIERTIRYTDEPYADDALLPTYLMCQLARAEVTVALSGDGGDELFAGYDKYRTEQVVNRLQWVGRSPLTLVAAATRSVSALPITVGWRDRVAWLTGMLETARLAPAERYVAKLSVCSPDFVRAIAPSLEDGLEERVAAILAEPAAENFTARMLYADLRFGLPNQMLRKVDRMSMASSLEVRVPLLDHELVEFAASLPSRQRICGTRGKYLLRRALAGRVPSSLLARRKQGFDVPLNRWFRESLTVLLRDTLSRRALAHHGFFRYAAVERLLHDHETGAGERSRQLFALLTFQLWYDAYIRDLAYRRSTDEGSVVIAAAATNDRPEGGAVRDATDGPAEPNSDPRNGGPH
jgi:asparagine synthase (glutamine-hydrolysing)